MTTTMRNQLAIVLHITDAIMDELKYMNVVQDQYLISINNHVQEIQVSGNRKT